MEKISDFTFSDPHYGYSYTFSDEFPSSRSEEKEGEFELVIYKIGASLYHKTNDSAKLRPNVGEIARYKFDITLARKTKSIYYLYKNNDKLCTPISPMFSSVCSTEKWRRMNKFVYGDVYIMECTNDECWTGHR